MTLNPIYSEAKKRRFETYDFEWVPGTLEMRLCGRYGPKGYRKYFSVDDFLNDTLTFSNRSKWFFAHAGGLADVQFIFEKLVDNRNYVIESSFSGSSAIIVKVKRDNHVWCFCDSYWLFRDSLANIGKKMGMEKTGPTLEISMSDKDVKEWYRTVPLDVLIPYNEQDCKILYRAIHAFQDLLLEEGGVLQKTIASCGMALFRRKFLGQSIRTNEGVNEIARTAYHASRVEVISHRCVDAKYYDFNSSFPYSMTKPQPGELLKIHRGLPDYLLQKKDRSYLVKARIKVNDCHIPAIPYREQRNNRLFFPTGTWTAWFTDVDYETVLSEGYDVLRVYESMEFNVFHDLGEYALSIYSKRKNESDPFMKLLYKYLMNAVYGKLAERPEKKKMWINPNVETLRRLNIKYKGIENCHVRGSVFMEDVVLPLQHVHVPISARITALSRKMLFDAITSSTRSYYCDTDGFATSDADFPVGNELGQLKLEKNIIQGNFYSPKVYSLDIVNEDRPNGVDKIVHAKGFSLGKQDTEEKKREAIKRFKDIVTGKEIEVERMSRIRENIKYRNYPIERKMTKRLTDNVIPKRFFYPDGESRAWDVEEIRKF